MQSSCASGSSAVQLESRSKGEWSRLEGRAQLSQGRKFAPWARGSAGTSSEVPSSQAN